MNARIRQYLFAIIFLGVGIYSLLQRDYSEASLYILAALAFIFNNLAGEPKLAAQRRLLVAITWILMGVTGVLFLYLLQSWYF
jgi:hypothetical protein